MANQSKESPYARMRRRLFALCGQQFENAPNIWLVYSGRTDRQWVLRSDLQYLHFLAIEFDPSVLKFDLAPTPRASGHDVDGQQVAFDAVVTFRDGHKEWRRMRVPPVDADGHAVPENRTPFERAAAEAGARYRLVTPDALESKRVRIQNSLRMLRFIAATRRSPLVSVRNSVMTCMKREPAMTLQGVVDHLQEVAPARVLAAVFQLVGSGRVELNLDHNYVNLGTVVRTAP